MSDVDLRFGGIERLYSAEGLQRLRHAKVCVVGIGGVGSWAAEALARSAVGQITLVDLDDVCESNINRQLHSLEETIGQPKTTVMAGRIKSINPRCDVRAVAEFFNESSAERILQSRFDWVIDAIDQTTNKCLLIARCCQNKIPIIASGGAGGRKDPLKNPNCRFVTNQRRRSLATGAQTASRRARFFARPKDTVQRAVCLFQRTACVSVQLQRRRAHQLRYGLRRREFCHRRFRSRGCRFCRLEHCRRQPAWNRTRVEFPRAPNAR